MRRRLVAALLATACVALPGGVASADGDSNQNLATAIVEQDGASAFDLAGDLDYQNGGTVDHLNQARALARCTDCDATAIAFQVVVAWGDVDTVEPKNSAIAINDGCERCVSYAGARQFVRVTEDPVRISRDGLRTLADVYRDLDALEQQELTLAQLVAAVEEQEARVNEVLNTQLVPARKGDGRVKQIKKKKYESNDEG